MFNICWIVLVLLMLTSCSTNGDVAAPDTAALLIAFGPVIVHSILSVALGLVNRRNLDPRHVGYVGRIIEPPDELRPALAAHLVADARSTATQKFLGTVFDLARRGHLVVAERRSSQSPAKTYISLLRTNTGTDDLDMIDQHTLDALFDGATQIDLDKRHGLQQAAAVLEKQYERELLALGYLSEKGTRRRRLARRNAWITGLTGVAAFGLAVLLGVQSVPGLMAAFAVVFFINCGFAGVFAEVRGTTQTGSDTQVAWKAFRDHLAKPEPPASAHGQFGRHLSYAVAYGVVKPFVKATSGGEEVLPTWLEPLPATDHDGIATIDLNNRPLLRTQREGVTRFLQKAEQIVSEFDS